VTTLESEGVFIAEKRGRGGRSSLYALPSTVQAYVGYVTKAPTANEERKARAERDQATAQLTRLRIEKERGELVSKRDVLTAGKTYTLAWRNKLVMMPSRLRQHGVIEARQEAQIAGFVREILSDISSWKTIADAEKDT